MLIQHHCNLKSAKRQLCVRLVSFHVSEDSLTFPTSNIFLLRIRKLVLITVILCVCNMTKCDKVYEYFCEAIYYIDVVCTHSSTHHFMYEFHVCSHLCWPVIIPEASKPMNGISCFLYKYGQMDYWVILTSVSIIKQSHQSYLDKDS